MAKDMYTIGYVVNVETRPGVWDDNTFERRYCGETVRSALQTQSSGGVNDNINIATDISIVSNKFANKNFQYMKYIEFMGAKWKIVKVDVRYPRLVLTMGGLYNNGQQS